MTDLAVPPVGTETVATSLVLKAAGLVDDAWLSKLRDAARSIEPGSRVVIDLTDSILVSSSPVDAAITTVAMAARCEPSALTLVSPRMSARLLLRRWGIADVVDVTDSIDAALEMSSTRLS